MKFTVSLKVDNFVFNSDEHNLSECIQSQVIDNLKDRKNTCIVAIIIIENVVEIEPTV